MGSEMAAVVQIEQSAKGGPAAEDDGWDAFICYRRSDGSTVARWVYDAMVGFRPGSAVGEWRPLRVFLDKASERASLDFYERDIKPALQKARCLIVVCTKTSDVPREDGSPNWQQMEIQDFLDGGDGRLIVPVVVDGPLQADLPCKLHEHFPNIHRVDGSSFRRRLWRLRPLLRATLEDEIIDTVGAVRNIPREQMEGLHRLYARARLRNLVAALVGVSLVVVLLVFLALGINAARASARAARDAEHVALEKESKALDNERAARASERAELVKSLTRQGAAVALRAPTSARLLFSRAIELGASDKLDRPARMWLGALGDATNERVLAHAGPVRAGAFAPTGSLLATGSDDGVVQIWSWPAGALVARATNHTKGITSLVFSHDGRRLASTSWDGQLVMADAATGAPLWRGPHSSAVNMAVFDPHDRWIAMAGWDSAVVWDVASGKKLANLTTRFMANAVDFDSNGRTLLVGDQGGQLCIYDTARWQLVRPCDALRLDGVNAARFAGRGHRYALGAQFGAVDLVDELSGKGRELAPDALNPTYAVAFPPERDDVLAAGMQRRAHVWFLDRRRPEIDLPDEGAVRAVEFDKAATHVLSGSDDGTARLRDLDRGDDAVLPFDHLDAVLCARFSPDERWVLTCGADGAARLRPIAGRGPFVASATDPDHPESPVSAVAIDPRGQLVAHGNNHSVVQVDDARDFHLIARVGSNDVGVGGVDDLAFDASGARLAVVGGTGPVRVFRVGDWHARPTLLGGGGDVASHIAFAPASDVLGVGYYGGEVRVYDASRGDRRGKAPAKLPTTSNVKALAVSPSGRFFASGHEDGSIVVWSSDGACLGKKADHGSELKIVVFAPDGLHLLTAGVGSDAYLWSFADGELDAATRRSFKHGLSIESAAFSPDGAKIVTAGEDQSVAVWSVRDGAELLPRLRHAQQLWEAEFSPDGLLLVTASQDGTAQVWDALTGEKIGPPMHHTQAVSMARFERDSQSVVTGGFDGRASLWRFPMAADGAEGLLARTEAATGLHLDTETGGIRLMAR